jgi:hypothetical protein
VIKHKKSKEKLPDINLDKAKDFDGSKINGWCFSRMDKEGPYKFEKIDSDIVTFLSGLEGCNLTSLKKPKGCHHLSYESLSREAKKRLAQLKLDDARIFSMKMANIPRIHGLFDRGIMYLLWNDPNHKVSPTSD